MTDTTDSASFNRLVKDRAEAHAACGHVRSFVQPNMTCTRLVAHYGRHRGNDGSEWGSAMGEAPDLEPATASYAATFAAKLDGLAEHLIALHELLAKVDDDQISNHLRCLGCLVEQHQGTRQEASPAATIVGGQATCLEHLQFADGPVLPGRTQSGLILGNGS